MDDDVVVRRAVVARMVSRPVHACMTSNLRWRYWTRMRGYRSHAREPDACLSTYTLSMTNIIEMSRIAGRRGAAAARRVHRGVAGRHGCAATRARSASHPIGFRNY